MYIFGVTVCRTLDRLVCLFERLCLVPRFGTLTLLPFFFRPQLLLRWGTIHLVDLSQPRILVPEVSM